MTAHDHRTYVDGCFRCDLSRDEVDPMTPHQAIADALRGWVEPDSDDPDPKIEAALVAACAADVEVALSDAGYEVVDRNLVEACRQLFVPPGRDYGERRGEALHRIRACLAILADADPTDVFTEGGA